MTNLKTAIEEAQHELRVYRHPNVGDVAIQLDKLLELLDRSQIRDDRVTSIDEEGDELVISTEYSLRCCAMTGEHRLPLSVVYADDPTEAAKWWMWKQELEKKEQNLKSHQDALCAAQRQVQELPDLIAKLSTELEAFKATQGDIQ